MNCVICNELVRKDLGYNSVYIRTQNNITKLSNDAINYMKTK